MKICKGYKICPKWLKDKYIQASNFKCQSCKKEISLEIHRIKRRNKGGLYTLVPLNHKENNVKVLCSSCHKLLHSNEWKNVQGK